jgi:hypothetical protein
MRAGKPARCHSLRHWRSKFPLRLVPADFSRPMPGNIDLNDAECLSSEVGNGEFDEADSQRITSGDHRFSRSSGIKVIDPLDVRV